ncbi:hypothetical protein [Hymenobacter actinosclerus]|uniref:Plasmid stabilization system protein ParE n=1 Tax=Hymenobacter actinosclerus TaxID=82805 RepID=A0A1I0I3L5_9BACT|nr:hypothetical protein [Hymenobacter actinosclerus]SET91177.1 hypothetical protein SAMN04487998_3120 [Hymenobacter actinosclerus]
MTVGGRELVLLQGFLDSLLELEQWAGQRGAREGRELVKRLTDFAFDTIAPFPLAFPVYPFRLAPDRVLRRAVLSRQYAVVYEVHATELVFVYAYSTLRNPDQLSLPQG